MTKNDLVMFNVTIHMTEEDHLAFMRVLSEKGVALSFECAVEGIVNVLSAEDNHGIISNLIDWSMENELDLEDEGSE